MNQSIPKGGYDKLHGINIENLKRDELKDTLNGFNEILCHIPHWIWRADQDFIINYNSPRVFDITGYSPADIYGLHVSQILFPPKLNDYKFEFYAEKLFSGQKTQIVMNHSIQHSDRSTRYLKTIMFTQRDRLGEIVGFQGITHDQTSQILARNTQIESDKKLQLILSNLSEIVYMLDSSGLISFISPSVEKYFDLLPYELMGQPFYEIFRKVSKTEPDGFKKELNDAIDSGKPSLNFEIQIDHNGVPYILDITKKMIFDSKGNVEGIAGVIRNITVKRRAESDMKAAFEGAINAIAVIVEQRDIYTSGHQQNVSKLSVAIAHELGLDKQRTEGLRIAALLHDVGKVGIPSEILNRPSRLNPNERKIIELHPQLGANILKQIPSPWELDRFAYEHHERMDGSGYPNGLVGEEISLEARIIGVADTIDSIVNHRPYKPAQDLNEAIQILSAESGIKFDPKVVEAVLRLKEKGFFDHYIVNSNKLF